MKIVVLGGTGFIGGAIVDSLISKGHEVKIGTRNTDFHNFQTNERINVVIPMVVIAKNRLTFKKAKLTPTAKASILVAIAKRRMS